jgi:tetratricopeptide (TPR) repeat protein
MAEIKQAKEAGEIMEKVTEALTAKNYAKVLDLYNKVLELLPNDNDSFTPDNFTYTKGGIYNGRGLNYVRLKQPEKALADFNKAISLEPKNGKFYDYRSTFYIENGEMEKAKPDIEKAVELNPKEAGYYYYNFANYIRDLTGDKKTAAVYYKKSVEHGDFIGSSKKQLAEWGM